ncbi:MAG: ribosome silencing factor [Caldithrix sp.]|nr:ribosome silencing factor [Caldithrix sp.]
MSAHQTAVKAAHLAQEKNGQHIVIIDISDKASYADFFVIASGTSNVQVKAIAEHVEKELKNQDIRPYHKEGYEYQNWILLDYVDVVVHIFREETRSFYGIERLWADAKMEFIKEEA